MTNKETVNPGFHKQFMINRFDNEEQNVLRKLSRSWYMTSSGEEVRLAQSKYNYFLMKPTETFSEMFNIEREIVCVFSNYEKFEPRSLDIFDVVFKKLPKMRSETVCGILISKSKIIEEKVESLLKSDPEYPVIIPFTYEELTKNYSEDLMMNRFRKHFYSRDLFSFLSPLKKDTYFFGRNNLINEISNRYYSGEHTSLFGLRKSGKTSIIYALQRKLDANGETSISIDCESPSIHKLRWHELLEKLVRIYHSSKNSKININFDNRYTDKLAADSFEEDFLKIYQSKKKQRSLLIFDEIERITPKTASSEHWRNDNDFVYFWQTMRGFYQKHPDVFSYMLVGTNPSCVESAYISDHENPIFASIPSQYVPSFTVEQVQEMVTKLGSYMGLKFDSLITGKLAEDFGGHPFLIRQMCSLLHAKANKQRPVNIDKALYQKVLDEFSGLSHEYLEMMVSVLKEWYPDEYQMLTFLANNDLDTFESFAVDHINYTRHLIGYGLIQKGSGGHAFNLEIIAKHLRLKHSKERINLNNEEKNQEISSRRNRIEKGLRSLVKNTLKTSYGVSKARTTVDSAIPENRRDKLKEFDLNEILDKDKSPLFLLEIINLINKEWSCFQHVFDIDKNVFMVILNEINATGRPEAHAKYSSQDEFIQLRLYFKKIEPILDEWGV